MTKHQQVTKNIGLSGELMSYMISNRIKSKPNHSYVVFSINDEKLNNANENLIKGLIKEGRKVIKAVKTNDPKEPWVLSRVV